MSDQELGTVTPLAEGYSEHVESQAAGVLASEFVEPQGESADAGQDAAVVAPSAAPPRGTITASRAPGTAPSHGRSAQMVPSACACQGQAGNTKVFAIGVLGYDFGTEARRDTFKQLMPQVTPQEKEGLIPVLLGMKPYPPPNEIFPANPYDFRQMVNYLRGYPGPEVPFPTEGGFPRLPFKHTEIVAEQKKDLSLPDPNQMHSFVDYPTSMHGDAFPPQIGTCPKNYPGFPGYISEASRLIWTLNIELTPVYAIRPSGSFTDLVYLRLVQALAGQVRSRDDDYYVSRVSIPGVLTGETVRLFSGQVVPVLEPQLQGMYSWNETKLICDAAEARGMDPHSKEPNVRRFRKFMDTYLNKLYYQLRNLGQTSAERALNFAATNAFQFATIAEDEATMEDEEGKPATRQLDTILVERSAFCRMDSDCWDVRIKFFDPNNHLKARSVYRYTVDVSDVHPVTIGEVRRWEEAFG